MNRNTFCGRLSPVLSYALQQVDAGFLLGVSRALGALTDGKMGEGLECNTEQDKQWQWPSPWRRAKTKRQGYFYPLDSISLLLLLSVKVGGAGTGGFIRHAVYTRGRLPFVASWEPSAGLEAASRIPLSPLGNLEENSCLELLCFCFCSACQSPNVGRTQGLWREKVSMTLSLQ